MYNLPGYNIFHKNRASSQRGGIAICIKSNLNCKLLDEFSVYEDSEFETLFVEIDDVNMPAVVGEIYRVQNTRVNLSLELFDILLEKLKSVKTMVITGTDQNFDCLKN